MIDFEDRGEGQTITFVHGFGLDARMWAPQMAHFAKTNRTIAVTLPGFGKHGAEVSGEHCSTEAILDVLDSRGVKKTHLIGHSFGGAIVTDFALAHPDRLFSLTLANALLLGRSPKIAAWSKCVAAAKSGDDEAARQAWLDDDLFAHARKNPALAATLATLVNDYACGHWNGKTTNRFLAENPAARFAEMKLPTLAISGALDSSAFHAMAREYTVGIANAREVMIPNAGHMANVENPDAFNEALQGQLRASDRSS